MLKRYQKQYGRVEFYNLSTNRSRRKPDNKLAKKDESKEIYKKNRNNGFYKRNYPKNTECTLNEFLNSNAKDDSNIYYTPQTKNSIVFNEILETSEISKDDTNNFQSSKKAKQSENFEIKNEEMFTMRVEVGPNQYKLLKISKSDSPYIAAKDFCLIYNLTTSYIEI